MVTCDAFITQNIDTNPVSESNSHCLHLHCHFAATQTQQEINLSLSHTSRIVFLFRRLETGDNSLDSLPFPPVLHLCVVPSAESNYYFLNNWYHANVYGMITINFHTMVYCHNPISVVTDFNL